MESLIVSVLVGALCIGIGISNMKGNISTLHAYHRNRVSEENRLPFGRKVGLGTAIIGAGIIVMGVLNAAAEYANEPLYMYIGTALFIVTLAVGLGLAVYAMMNYTKGVF